MGTDKSSWIAFSYFSKGKHTHLTCNFPPWRVCWSLIQKSDNEIFEETKRHANSSPMPLTESNFDFVWFFISKWYKNDWRIACIALFFYLVINVSNHFPTKLLESSTTKDGTFALLRRVSYPTSPGQNDREQPVRPMTSWCWNLAIKNTFILLQCFILFVFSFCFFRQR